MAVPSGRDRTRAELFEDEKRRIIDSCFSKKDEDGSGKPRPITALSDGRRDNDRYGRMSYTKLTCVFFSLVL
jgi:hypothetical protein